MKIILSRKGFDSSYGGVPSPIFPDGRMLSLPIPAKDSQLSYEEIAYGKENLGDIVSTLTCGKIKHTFNAHLDPDLRRDSRPRKNGWKPAFGQADQAQRHLTNQGVKKEDIFLFFGLFQEVKQAQNPSYLFVGKRKHVIWGWMQVEEVLKVDKSVIEEKYPWAVDHPHYCWDNNYNNTLYIAKKNLKVNNINSLTNKGAGVFRNFTEELQLTVKDSPRVTDWKLPKAFFPNNGKPSMTYHPNISKWKLENNSVVFQSARRGQEFVVDCDSHPERVQWACDLIDKFG